MAIRVMGVLALCVPLLVAAGPRAPAILAPGFVEMSHATRAALAPIGATIDDWTLRHEDRPPIRFVAAILPRDRYRATLRVLLRGGATTDLFRRDLCPGAWIVTNGGFYRASGSALVPVGLVRHEGRTLSKPGRRRSGGFLAMSEGRVTIIDKRHADTALRARDAIETTPIVIADGRSAMLSDDGILFDRIAIGLTASGDLIVVGAFARDQETVSLMELGLLARAAAERRRKTLESLIALDGGPSAHIYLPRTDALLGMRGPVFLPNAICVGAR